MIELLLIIIILILLSKGNGNGDSKRSGGVIHCNPVKFKKPPIPKKASVKKRQEDIKLKKCHSCNNCKEEK